MLLRRRQGCGNLMDMGVRVSCSRNSRLQIDFRGRAKLSRVYMASSIKRGVKSWSHDSINNRGRKSGSTNFRAGKWRS